MKNENNYLKLIFSPDWGLIEGIRNFIEDFTLTSLKWAGLAKASALTASELLDNAVKFSSGNRVSLEVVLTPESGEKEEVTITVENYADEQNIKRLKTTLKEIKQTSPRDAYLMKLKIAMDRGMGHKVSELGLARIQYEACALCSLHIHDDNRVSLSAKLLKKRL
ncbi:MAG: hypothetical protein JXB88_06020 [Spirochaetales bacterium]|nr:hypothetical protein [Spirochaetales bacterium]